MTSLDRLITKKAKKKESTAPVLSINDAVVKVLSAELLREGDVITKKDGSTFTIDKPHIACEMEVVDAPKRKRGDVGTTWYEKFYYPETKKESGEYENRQGTKIGAVTELIHGEDCWDDDEVVLDPDDLEGLTFICNLVPKTEVGSTKVIGTRIDHESVEPLPEEEEEPEIEAPEFPKIAEEA